MFAFQRVRVELDIRKAIAAFQKTKMERMKAQKPPPGKRDRRAQAKGLDSPLEVAPSSAKRAEATKVGSSEPTQQQKTRELLQRNVHVLNEFWWVVYHDVLFVGKGALGITIRYSDPLTEILLLLIILLLQYYNHVAPVYLH